MAKIRVPQPSGEITLTRGGSEVEIFEVKAGVVEIPDDYVDGFLRWVPGSEVVSAGNPSPKTAGGDAGQNKEAKQ